MNKLDSREEKIRALIDYYRDKGLLIVGLNDSQGVNITTTFFKKGLLDYIAYALTSEELTPEVINAFSLTMNKTEHIDYFLKNNLSLEEIKLSQIYSAVSAFEKVMQDIRLPRVLGQLGNVYRLIYTPKEGDENIKISTSLEKANEPIMIYSSGVNNMMRAVGNNPFGIKASYKNRDKNPNYDYTVMRANDRLVLESEINAIKRNFDSILGINPRTDIYTLGAYVPKSFEKEELNIFRDLVLAYNEALSNLCKQYDINFIATEEIGKRYLNSEANFHITTAGHNALANYIIDIIYQNKIVNQNIPNRENIKPFEFYDKGASGVIDALSIDQFTSIKDFMESLGYQKVRDLAIAQEHAREIEVFQRVLKRTK